MRISVIESKNRKFYRIIDTVPKIGGGYKTVTIENLGSNLVLEEKFPGRDPLEVTKERLAELERIKAESEHVLLPKLSSAKRIPSGKQVAFQGGYLFLQKIYSKLGLQKLCKEIAKDYKFDFDLSEILSYLLYTRILEPGSKRSSFEVAKNYLEPPGFELHDVYRALEVMAKENDRIQAWVYKESKKLVKRNDKVLFYDLTNYFFEIEEADGIRQYGVSKENRPNPLVQMGLFLDGSGFPLAFSIHPGNTNEQTTLKPLEKKILKDFELSDFIVCTDAGLSSTENRLFNTLAGRAFVTTQSLKKLKAHLRDWALNPEGWELTNSSKKYSLAEIDEEDPNEFEKTYYKSRWIKEDGLEQKLVVSFSLKYKDYQRSIREAQLVRAEKKLRKPSSLKKKRPNDPARFIHDYPVTAEGELAERTIYELDLEKAEQEARFDGFYAVCTNLEATPSEILAVNKQRWQIEEAFRTLKSEFKARPVYLQREDRILGHFMTCFLALLIFKILKVKVEKHIPSRKLTTEELREGLQSLNFHYMDAGAYIPNYTRTDLTDALHEVMGFRTDFEVLTAQEMKKIFSFTKK